MNKIIVFSGENFESANSAVIKQLNPFDLSKKNIVFVPSGAEDYAEKLIFDVHKTSVFFGVKITSVQKFLEETLGQLVLPNLKQKLLLRKALKNLKPNLKLFKNEISCGVLDQIFEEISRFEDAFLMPEDLENLEIKDKFLKDKVFELKEIYKEYLYLLGENAVLFTLKKKFLENSFDFKNTNFYFLSFEHFSKSDKVFINALAQNGGKVFVAGVNSQNQGNSYVFDVLTFENFEEHYAQNTLGESAEKLSRLAFSVDSTKQDLDFLRVIETENPKEEVFMTARQIKKFLFEGKVKQQDITIVCGNLSLYAEEISKVFDDFGFDFYINESTLLSDLSVSKFLLGVLSYVNKPSPQIFQNIIISDFVEIKASQKQLLCNIVEQKGVLKKQDDFNSLPQDIQNAVLSIENHLSEIKSQTSFSLKIQKAIELFKLEEKLEANANVLLSVDQEGKVHAQKVVIEKIFDFCNQTEMFENEFSEYELFELFENFLKETLVSNPQKERTVILVCGAEEFFSKSKIVFVIGANQGALPSEKNDTAILTDANLNALGLEIVSVTQQNRINRRKVLNTLTCFEDLIFISYALTDQTGQKLLPSGFVKSLCEIAKQNVLKDATKAFFEDAGALPIENKAEIFAQMLGTTSNAKKTYIKLNKNGDREFGDLLPSLKDVFPTTQKQKIDDNLDGVDKKALFFAGNKTKVSQIESYYACPFAHFLKYGLKLSENSKPKFMAVDTGNLLHKIAEEFLSNQNTYVLNDDVEQSVEEIFASLQTEPNFEKVFYEENAVSLEILKDEALRFCTFLKSTQTKSNYKPKFLEVYFGKTQKFSLSVRGEDFSLVGIVDRVDVFNDGAVVIDYKTSSHAQGKNQELFYGEKIQIFVYAKALEKLFNLKPQGVFYFPITNGFSDVGKAKPYMLAGKNIKTEDFLSNFDTTLTYDNPKSKIFPCAISTSEKIRQQGIIKYAENKTHEEKKHFDAMIEYAVKLVENAIEEILDGSFAVNPRKDACKFCPYLSVCQKNKVTNERTLEFEINSPTFWAVLEGEEDGKNPV